MKYNFKEDIKESNDYRNRVSIHSGDGLSLMDHGSMLDMVWYKFKNKCWWILVVSLDLNDLLIEIEELFYPPKSGKNAGFELIPLFHDRAAIAFAHKSFMNAKQLTAIVNKFNGNTLKKISEEEGDFLLCTHNINKEIEIQNLYLELFDYISKQSSNK